jgi:hypothetical protein
MSLFDFSTAWELLIKKRTYRQQRRIRRNRAGRLIQKCDTRPVPAGRGEIRLFMVARNEAMRLPFMIEYYRSLGVDRLFILDNDSTDESLEILKRSEKTHVFHTQDAFTHKADWLDHLLHRYGVGHWCVLVDADEKLVIPHAEFLSLRTLCHFLDKNRFEALDFTLLDIYSEKPLAAVSYLCGEDPLRVADCFDPNFIQKKSPPDIKEHQMIYRGPARFYGGMRKRVFGMDACLSKFALFKFKRRMYLSPGAHFIESAKIAELRGALLHFKFLNDFSLPKIKEQVERGFYWRNSVEYKTYLMTIEHDSNLCLHHPASLRYKNSKQLIDLGIIQSSKRLDQYAEKLSVRKVFKDSRGLW